ncbi:hypothetical protein [Kutzneria albida]|uniref:Uncharacterized protein n=1 Tax=Kutzneria albida DSM 43870 TaxID=1449976 RepID=W5WBI0_9PSEU|nr:hypothetical protein [Kutzneria albida]AHH98212.1 hypothetical protein KALB_4850 [Kutzneria albida DSM 43870]
MTAPDVPLRLDQLIPDVVAWGVAVPATEPGAYVVIAEKSRREAEDALSVSAEHEDPDQVHRLTYYHPTREWVFHGTGQPVRIGTAVL